MSAAVSFRITRTRGDYFWAVLFNMLRSGLLVWSVVGVVLVTGISIAANSGRPPEEIAPLALGVFIAMTAVYALGGLGCVYWAAWKNWSAPGAFEPVDFILSSEGVEVAGVAGQGKSAWSVWKSAWETEALIILRHHFNMIQIIPKRDLSAATLDQIRAVLRAKTHLQGAAP